MATLKGQNFRVLIYDSTASAYKVVGMATNATINLTGNTDDAATKDDVGGASKPEITSKSWSVSVDSLNVADTGALLTAIKAYQLFTLMWDETDTTNNQSIEEAAFARSGQAFLNDVTFTFGDRANSTKSLQFTGSGALSKITTTPSTDTVAPGNYTKGQFVRLFLGSDNTVTPAKVLAAAKNLSVHVSLSLEDATTKDTDGGDWQVQEPTGLSYDISTNALVRSADVITSSVASQDFASVEEIYEASLPVKFQVANVSGANQRTKGAVIMSGSVVITSLSVNSGNRATVTYDTTLNGYGEYTVGS
jgi:hypothetical protein